MEKCKFCQAELAENGTFCPNCGRNNAEEEIREETVPEVRSEAAPAEETVPAEENASAEESAAAEEAAPVLPEEKKSSKTPLIIAAVVVLAALLVALVVGGMNKKPAAEAPAETTVPVETIPATVPADGNPEDVTCKGSYTVEDEAAIADKDTVVATIGEKTLTNAQLRIYYRSAISSFMNTEYGYYMMMYGMMDYAKPLDTQISYENQNQTWQQFFLQSALDNWQLTQAMALEAEKNGLGMAEEDQAYLEELRASLDSLAQENSMALEDMLVNDFGAGVTYADFEAYQKLYLTGNPYYEAETAKLVPTEEQLEAYFQAHEEEYASSGITMDSHYVDVRHILVQVEGGTAGETGATTYSDEEWAACEAEAQAILDDWLAGDKTEDSFAALANEKSEDPGSNTNGGLYENVYPGQMVEPFENWCFDESRQYGDYGLVKTSYGYHVMYYVGSSPMWKTYAESGWINEQVSLLLEQIVEDYPMDVTYEAITLGDVAVA